MDKGGGKVRQGGFFKMYMDSLHTWQIKNIKKGGGRGLFSSSSFL